MFTPWNVRGNFNHTRVFNGRWFVWYSHLLYAGWFGTIADFDKEYTNKQSSRHYYCLIILLFSPRHNSLSWTEVNPTSSHYVHSVNIDWIVPGDSLRILGLFWYFLTNSSPEENCFRVRGCSVRPNFVYPRANKNDWFKQDLIERIWYLKSCHIIWENSNCWSNLSIFNQLQ